MIKTLLDYWMPLDPCSHDTQNCSGNGSQAISEQFNVHVNSESAIPIENSWRCVLGTVLRLDQFLDHYLLLRVKATWSWKHSSGLDRAWLASFWCYLLQNGVYCKSWGTLDRSDASINCDIEQVKCNTYSKGLREIQSYTKKLPKPWKIRVLLALWCSVELKSRSWNTSITQW